MTEPTPTLRSFVAVPLPGAVQTEIAAVATELGRELPGVKWTKKPENLHVTIKFLGPVAADRLDELSAALGEALKDLAPFRISVQGFGAFPSAARAKVLFAGIDKDVGARRSLAELAEIIEEVASRFGFAREERAFTAHVTVGRSKEGVDARRALARFEERAFGEVDVCAAHVYESRLGGEGSTYVLRSRAVLGAKN